MFKDTTLRHDLQHLLDVLINAKKKDLKKLTVFAKVYLTHSLANVARARRLTVGVLHFVSRARASARWWRRT